MTDEQLAKSAKNISPRARPPKPETIEQEKRDQLEALDRIRKMLGRQRPRRRREDADRLSWARGISAEA